MDNHDVCVTKHVKISIIIILEIIRLILVKSADLFLSLVTNKLEIGN